MPNCCRRHHDNGFLLDGEGKSSRQKLCRVCCSSATPRTKTSGARTQHTLHWRYFLQAGKTVFVCLLLAERSDHHKAATVKSFLWFEPIIKRTHLAILQADNKEPREHEDLSAQANKDPTQTQTPQRSDSFLNTKSSKKVSKLYNY